MRKRSTPAPVYDCDQLEDGELAWRTSQYLRMGFVVTDAALLAGHLVDDAPLDWQRADALVVAGCPLDLVKAILL